MEQIADLTQRVHECRLCPLAESRSGVAVPSMPGTNYRPGGVALLADMVQADADAASGTPYAGGRADVRFLHQSLLTAGLEVKDVLLMFRVRCKPPRGRVNDYPEALYNCDTWTREELDSYAPGVVVLMGQTVLETVYGKEASVGKTRGKPRHTGARFEWGARTWVPTYHLYAASKGGRPEAQFINDLKLAKGLVQDGSV